MSKRKAKVADVNVVDVNVNADQTEVNEMSKQVNDVNDVKVNVINEVNAMNAQTNNVDVNTKSTEEHAMNAQTFKFSTLLGYVSTLEESARNVVFRTWSTGALASWTNSTIKDVSGASNAKSTKQLIQDAQLAGCSSIAILEQFEAEERERNNEMIAEITASTALPVDTAFAIYQGASELARKTAALGNPYEKPMSLASWIRFLIQQSLKEDVQGYQSLAEVSGYSLEMVTQLSREARVAELKRIDAALPALLDQFKIDLVNNKTAIEDVELDIFNYFKLLVKAQMKLEKAATDATNRALRYARLDFLDQARIYRADAAYLQKVVDEFEKDYEEELAVWQDAIHMMRQAA